MQAEVFGKVDLGQSFGTSSITTQALFLNILYRSTQLVRHTCYTKGQSSLVHGKHIKECQVAFPCSHTGQEECGISKMSDGYTHK